MAGTLSSRKLVFGLLLLTLLVVAPSAFAESSQKKGDGSIRVAYQYIRTGAFDSSIGEIDIGNTDSHAVLLSGDYAFNERWRVFASLPYIKKRHTGALPHDPTVDFVNYTPPDLRVTDDGDYHGGFQDMFIGMSYLAVDGPLTVEPFVSYGLPTRDYPFYAHAAIGRNLWHLPVGVSLTYTPYFSDWFFASDIAYVFTEKTSGVDVSHWLIYAEAAYYFTPRFAPKVFVSIKDVPSGLSFPDDFPPEAFDSKIWYTHDRTIKHSFVNAGVGFDYILNNKYQLSGSVYSMLEPDQVNIVDYAFTVGLTRYFSGD